MVPSSTTEPCQRSSSGTIPSTTCATTTCTQNTNSEWRPIVASGGQRKKAGQRRSASRENQSTRHTFSSRSGAKLVLSIHTASSS